MSNYIKEAIKETYTNALESDAGCGCAPTCCSPSDSDSGSFAEDYSQLEGYNPDADYGLGCGLPTESAFIKSGDTVLDLGSGAGNDVFVARRVVGEKGKVIGIDMTNAMIEKANENKAKLGYNNVEFILGDIEEMPIPSKQIDVVISNCVLNLVEDKARTYKEIYRVLKPQGRFSISDVVVTGALTKEMSAIIDLYAGCVAGAMIKDNYLDVIKDAGFKDIKVEKEKAVYLPDDFLRRYLTKQELNEYRATNTEVLSITVTGYKD